MKTKLVGAIALLGLSMGTAQAVDLTFNDSHTLDGEVDLFYFDNNSIGGVSLWTDTLQDGFDSNGALFKLNTGTGQYDFVTEVANATESAFNPTLGYNTTGLNDSGVAIKNGFIQDNSQALGVSDTGDTFNLDAGSYLFTIAGFDNTPAASLFGGGTLDDGFVNVNGFFGPADPEREWSTWTYNTGGVASNYDVFISGKGVSAVPVPAAVWLFATAIAGLGAAGRSRKAGALAA